MLCEKIMSVHNALGALAHRVDRDTWAVLKLAKNELLDVAAMVRELESGRISRRCKTFAPISEAGIKQNCRITFCEGKEE